MAEVVVAKVGHNPRRRTKVGFSLKKPLVNMLLDPEVSEEQFLEQLRADRSERNSAWKTYRIWVSHLKPKVVQEPDENS